MTQEVLPPKKPRSGNYQLSRFNAVNHGILSKYTVLPWEDEKEYRELLDSLVVEHNPQGPTELHLIEELAGIIWQKKRLRRATLSLHREALSHAIDSTLRGADGALRRVTRSCPNPFAALNGGSAKDKAETLRDLEAYRKQVSKALEVLSPFSGNNYEKGLAELHVHTQEWWLESSDPPGEPHVRTGVRRNSASLFLFLDDKVLPWCDRVRDLITDQNTTYAAASLAVLQDDATERLGRYDTSFDRKFERTLATLLKLQSLRRAD
jgi:hypothetical protein